MTKFSARTTHLSLFVSRDGDLRYEMSMTVDDPEVQNCISLVKIA